MMPVGRHPSNKCVCQVGDAPAPNPVDGIRRNVRGSKSAERRGKRQTAAQPQAFWLAGCGMAGGTIACIKNITPPLDISLCERERVARPIFRARGRKHPCAAQAHQCCRNHDGYDKPKTHGKHRFKAIRWSEMSPTALHLDQPRNSPSFISAGS